jgi:hypothetical protein
LRQPSSLGLTGGCWFESNPGSFLEPIVIAKRYRGPESSGNGGYTSGLVAERVGRLAGAGAVGVGAVAIGAVEVTLRAPPPLERPLRVLEDAAVDGGATVHVFDGETLVAEGRAAELDLELPETVAYAEAVRLAESTPPDPEHPFPGCFTCGPNGEGLRLRTAAAGDGRVVAPWRPEAPDPLLVWAALDCPGAFAVNPENARGLTVLGRLTARIDALPEAGDECVVVAWPLGGEGRRLFAGTAVFRGEQALARAKAVWIVVGDEFRDAVPSRP